MMGDIGNHLQCQECLVTFETPLDLQHHRDKFRALSERIRTWDEQCRAHIEPVVEFDEPDQLDAELRRDHPALLGARACPVVGCGKMFDSKKRLNIHFESHDECACSEVCVVCQKPFSNIRRFLLHDQHREAIARHRSYIHHTREELRQEARMKLHRLLIEAYQPKTQPAKRGPEAVSEDQSAKKVRVATGSTQASDIALQVHAKPLESTFSDSVPRDPFAAPMFPSNGAPSGLCDPFAALLFRYQNGGSMEGNNAFLSFSGPPLLSLDSQYVVEEMSGHEQR